MIECVSYVHTVYYIFMLSRYPGSNISANTSQCDRKHTTMAPIILIFAVLYQFSIGECSRLWYPHATNVTWPLERALNKTTYIIKTVPLFNETTLANFTYTLSARVNTSELSNSSQIAARTQESQQVDCFGLGKTVATTLEWFFRSKPNGSDALDVQFLLSSRKQPHRVQVVLGEQFGLEWTDFKIERRTVIIVHGFLSHGQESWIRDVEKALLEWDDINVVIIDWSAGGNTWNYYKAAVNTKIVGYQVSRFIEHVTNATISNNGSDVNNWGPLHLVGHSLGAHICGFAARELKKRHNRWIVQRITGLDPAQPCFRKADTSIHLHKNDAPFVDVIHTNARLLTSLGLGLPEAIGSSLKLNLALGALSSSSMCLRCVDNFEIAIPSHVDFYPNGGKIQPGCIKTDSSYFNYLPIPTAAIQQAICSHGRSYVYLTESLISATARNCSFWAHQWNLTYRHLLQIISEPCDRNICTEMGIRAEMYNQRGSFFVATASNSPFCANSTDVTEEVQRQLQQEHFDDMED